MGRRQLGVDLFRFEVMHFFTTSDECGIIAAVMKASGNEFMYDVTSYDAYPAIFDKGVTK